MTSYVKINNHFFNVSRLNTKELKHVNNLLRLTKVLAVHKTCLQNSRHHNLRVQKLAILGTAPREKTFVLFPARTGFLARFACQRCTLTTCARYNTVTHTEYWNIKKSSFIRRNKRWTLLIATSQAKFKVYSCGCYSGSSTERVIQFYVYVAFCTRRCSYETISF